MLRCRATSRTGTSSTATVPRLAAWDLHAPVLQTNCPPVTSITTDFGDFPLVGRDLLADGVPLGVAPRRSRLDALLVEAAVAAGAELRDRFAVQEYTRDGDRITGIAGRDARDGARQRRRRRRRAQLRPGAQRRRDGIRVGADRDLLVLLVLRRRARVGLELYARPGRVVFSFPTNDDLVGLFVGFV